MIPSRQQGFIHPFLRRNRRQRFRGSLDAHLLCPLVLVVGLNPLLTVLGVDPSPWLVPVGGGALIFTAWFVWRQRARLRQRWQAVHEELHKLY